MKRHQSIRAAEVPQLEEEKNHLSRGFSMKGSSCVRITVFFGIMKADGGRRRSWCWTSRSSSAAWSVISDEMMLVRSVRQKVTLFFTGWTFFSFGGLERARCFHLIAQRLTTLWRSWIFCRAQAELMRTAEQTQEGFEVTHLFLVEVRQAGGEVTHVRCVREDARHALPQQLVSVDLSSFDRLVSPAALLWGQQPPFRQHLQRVYEAEFRFEDV